MASSSVSPAGRHDDPHMVQENRATKLKLQTERHLHRKRGKLFFNIKLWKTLIDFTTDWCFGKSFFHYIYLQLNRLNLLFVSIVISWVQITLCFS